MISNGPTSAYDSETFGQDASFKLEQPVGSMSISPCGRDVVLASKEGLHIIDLDSPYSPPRYLPHHSSWEVADVQWSPHAHRDYWVVSTSNQKALVWNLATKGWQDAIDHKLHAHTRAITDINFSAHNPDVLATCAVDSFVHCWDLRTPSRPVNSFSDWFAGATQVKWSRQDSHVVASSHDKFLHIWDDRNGAHPTRSIEAHGTKIYGIDWNRFHPKKIVTCSLDKTIKFWDCNNPEAVPERIIETPFPVWRARHTPFGWGLLAMPQRGSSDLHLYDRREEAQLSGWQTAPVFSFEGHTGQVKEFLWRARGNVVDGIDHRDFQLVSWGTDRELRLHRVESETLSDIGYEKGITRTQRLNFTRKGAIYQTYRDGPSDSEPPTGFLTHRESSSIQVQSLRLRPRGSTSVGMSKVAMPQLRGLAQKSMKNTRTGMHGKANIRQDMSPITWMKSVRIETEQDTLAEEVTQIGKKFPKVEFEELDIQQRRLTISLYGPWGDDGASVYLRAEMKFPKLYPRAASARIAVQKTTAVTDTILGLLMAETQTIAETYGRRSKGCIEAILKYLLRDQSMEQAISSALNETLIDAKLSASTDLPGDVSSDDDDDPIQAPADLLNASNANVRVPLAKACGALWSDSGKLVCFFPPKANEPSSIINFLESKDSDQVRSVRMFEGFGRLHTSSPGPRTTIGAKTDDDGSSDTSEISESTSSGSSVSSDDARVIFSGFLPHKAWQRSAILQRRPRSAERSIRSTNGFGQAVDPARTNIISIHTFDDLVLSKPTLALGYRIFGNGLEVCDHNALVAQQASDETAVSVWRLAKLILQNNVPLECFKDPATHQDIITIAKTVTMAPKRRDSGVDLSHDFKVALPPSLALGRIRWGNSPMGPAYLIPALFNYFEIMGDVQMLAMLSCVFAEPRATHPETLLAPNEDQDLSIELKAPAFSIDYYPTLQIAKSIISPEPSSVFRVAGRVPSMLPPTPILESSSSEAAHSNDATSQKNPLATGNTPPSAAGISFQKSRRSSRASSAAVKELGAGEPSPLVSGAVSISTSPEDSRQSQRSNSSLAFSYSRASLSALQQVYSSSPPIATGGVANSQKSHSPSGSQIPSVWSTGGIFGSSSGGRGSRTPQQASAASSDEQRSGHLLSSSSFSNLRNPRKGGSETPEISHAWRSGLSTVQSSGARTVKPAGKRKSRVKVTVHDQDKFDNEGYASVPLLDLRLEWKYRSYRASYAHLLGVWELYSQMAEILKFDGLVGYFTLGSDADVQSELTLGNIRRRKTGSEDSMTADVTKRGLEMRRCCRECGIALAPIEKNGIPIGWHCTTLGCSSISNRTSIREVCTICNKMVSGLMVPCLQCGHVSCYDCAQGWFGSQGASKIASTISVDEDDATEDTTNMEQFCPSGCGCVCASLRSISVPFPTDPETDHENEESPPLNRQQSHASHRSERLMSSHGPDTAIGAFLSLTRTRSISAAKVSMLREATAEDSTAIVEDPMTPSAIDQLDPWSKSNFAGLGRGVGAGLSRGLSTKSSDATIRKSTDG